ncbi:MAG TPA: hypothetical protein VGN44_04600 [Candidatus Angelobacter sp.]|jgi:hypothetical protein
MHGLEQCSPDNLLTAKRILETRESAYFSIFYAEFQQNKANWKDKKSRMVGVTGAPRRPVFVVKAAEVFSTSAAFVICAGKKTALSPSL